MGKRIQNLTLKRAYNINLQTELIKFDDESSCLVYFFRRLLKEYSWPSPFNYISITLGKPEFESFNSIMYTKEIEFDFEAFYKLEKRERQAVLLKILVDVFERISESNNLDISLIKRIEDEIYKAEFRNIFFVRNKLFRSPKHNFYMGIECHCCYKNSKVFVKLYEKDKKTLIENELIFEIETLDFEILNFMKPRWIDNETFLLHYENNTEYTFVKNVGSVKIVRE